MNVRINLLPHREVRRERRKKEFVVAVAAVAMAAAAAAFGVGMVIDGQVSAQQARNAFVKAKTAELEEQIKEIANLRAEIDALRSRQTAVESLQANRTIPVHLLDELVARMPEGAFLRGLKQEERRVSLVGVAQSNERVSDLLRALANDSPWLERPELIEIKAVALGAPGANKTAKAKDGKDGLAPRRVYEFSLNALVKGLVDPAEQGSGKGGKPAGKAPVVAKAGK